MELLQDIKLAKSDDGPLHAIQNLSNYLCNTSNTADIDMLIIADYMNAHVYKWVKEILDATQTNELTDIQVSTLDELVKIMTYIARHKQTRYQELPDFMPCAFHLFKCTANIDFNLPTKILDFILIVIDRDFDAHVKITEDFLQTVFTLFQTEHVPVEQSQSQALHFCATIFKTKRYSVFCFTNRLQKRLTLVCFGVLQSLSRTNDSRIQNIMHILSILSSRPCNDPFRELVREFGMFSEIVSMISHQNDIVRIHSLEILANIINVNDLSCARPIIHSTLLSNLCVVFIQGSDKTIQMGLWVLIRLILCRAVDIMQDFSFLSYFPYWLHLENSCIRSYVLWLLYTYLHRANLEQKRVLLINNEYNVIGTIVKRFPQWRHVANSNDNGILAVRIAVKCCNLVVNFILKQWEERKRYGTVNETGGNRFIHPSDDLFWLIVHFKNNEFIENMKRVTEQGTWFKSEVPNFFEEIGKFKLM